ncbi:molecular chaperone [Salmonella enterica]|uniref:Molecular chaperone n=1 Tax=Salmonella enterica TaxID=28901 RepID=A0A5U6SQ07_SALER|nr:molecular chaperone [Salmonella enterica]EBR0846452.1 molecular chaperone [Salmonella enterica]EEK5000075.1 fimbria/pilus periplasmic chaperone [Salmonella enterica]EHD9191790.1 molecular chaperone [Salmonella enterica]EJN0489784.1 molecular chaperone [Salmonella enterica]
MFNSGFVLRLFPVIAGMLLFSFSATASYSASQEDRGGFSLGGTRVIYDGSKKEATVTVINSAKDAPFLAQSWVDNYVPSGEKRVVPDTRGKPPFLVTPPLYRQDQGKNMLRIVRVGGQLPTDRESVYWLNVKAIPAVSPLLKGKNTLQFAYVLRIKLFYRPEGITGDPVSAGEQLTFRRQGQNLVVKNPSPYYITFNKISMGGAEVKDTTLMVPPLGEQQYPLPATAAGKTVKYRVLNDHGGILPELTREVSF